MEYFYCDLLLPFLENFFLEESYFFLEEFEFFLEEFFGS
jgi:hypothetical protein